jgi:2-polyprenyl-6-methoxyphenol hydroxylase-like FAD-dependent oxidoreductase
MQGHEVTLFERFASPQPVGSGLMIQPTGFAVLQRLGIGDRILREGAKIDRLFGKAGARVVLDVHYRALRHPRLFGIGVHRGSLFDALYDAVSAAKIPVRTGLTICGSELDRGGRRLQFTDGTASERFDLIVDALGTRTALASPCGKDFDYGALWTTVDLQDDDSFDRSALQQRYRRSSVMAGVLPIGRGANGHSRAAFFWSLRCDRLDQWRTAGIDQWKAEVSALWPETAQLLEQISAPEELTFARYSHRTLKHPAEPALIHIGDAWHSASPQLGQGANMALLDAWALAVGLDQAGDIGQALGIAISMRRRHVQLYQWLTAVFTPVYQSDSKMLPLIRDRVVGPLSKVWPATWIQAAMVSGLIGRPLRSLGLSE